MSAPQIPLASQPKPQGLWMRRISPRLPTILVGLVVVALVVPPLVLIVASAFSDDQSAWGARSLDHYRTVFEDGVGWTVVKNSLVFAGGSGLLSVVMATALALLVERTNAPFRRAVWIAVIISFAVPTIIQSMGWILLLGPDGSFYNETMRSATGDFLPEIDLYTMAPMIFVQSIILLPAMFLLIAPTLRLFDPTLEQAALLSGASRLRTFRSITLPLALPSIIAACFLAFIVAIEAFEVPALIGSPGRVFVLSTSIYSRIRGYNPDYGSAAAFSTILMLFTLVGIFLYHRATTRSHRYVTVTGKGYRPERIGLGRWRWPAGFLTLMATVVLMAPIVILGWASFLPVYSPPALAQAAQLTVTNYREALSDRVFTDSLKTSLLLGVGSAVIVMLLTLVVAWIVLRRRSRTARAIDQIATFPLVVPGVVLSLALLRTYINLPIEIYGTVWLILIAYVIHFMPYGLRYTNAGLVALHPELEEAARVSGAGQMRTFARIIVPLMYPALLAGGLFVFLASIRQLSVAVFLVGPDVNTVANSMFTMWSVGSLSNAAAAAMVVVAVVLVLGGILFWITGLRRSGGLGSLNPRHDRD